MMAEFMGWDDSCGQIALPHSVGGNGPGGVGDTESTTNLALWLQADEDTLTDEACTLGTDAIATKQSRVGVTKAVMATCHRNNKRASHTNGRFQQPAHAPLQRLKLPDQYTELKRPFWIHVLRSCRRRFRVRLPIHSAIPRRSQ